MQLVFLNPGTITDDAYYRDEVLMELLPAIRSIADEVNIFQQDSAPVHRAHQTVELLHRENPEFSAPDYHIWRTMQEHICHMPTQDMAELWHRLMSVIDEANDQWQKIRHSMPQFMHKKLISNSCFDTACHVFHVSDISNIVLVFLN